jgi:hypothetical protein
MVELGVKGEGSMRRRRKVGGGRCARRKGDGGGRVLAGTNVEGSSGGTKRCKDVEWAGPVTEGEGGGRSSGRTHW